ncbi:MAG: cation:proton antiporter [Nanoarchaeota archaeon]
MEDIFLEVGIIIIATTILALIFRLFKQPPIVAYIFTGVILGPLVLNIITTSEILDIFSKIGIAFLLFVVGLSLNVKILREVGKVSFYTGMGQVLFTTIIGYFVIKYFGFSSLESAYMGIAFAFSSTIIIVKLLSDKNDLDTLYGKISLGFLLIQDALAILLLIFLSTFSNGKLTTGIGSAVLSAIALCLVAFLANKLFLTKFFERAARSQEILFLSAISWCFALAMFAQLLGFTLEIGAFLAGVTLASIPYSTEISNKVKPLRDFFMILFFVIMGSSLVFTNLEHQLPAIIIISLFVLIGNPLILMIIMGVMGFKSRTGFLCGLTVAQISEFSLILAAMGKELGHFSGDIVSMISAVGIITITFSTYMITYNEKLFSIFAPYLKIFERKSILEEKMSLHKKSNKYEIILLGQHRMGYSILKNLLKKKSKVLVVDYNPTVIKDLVRKNIPCLYGDVADPEILHALKQHKPKIIISTISQFEDNALITKIFREMDRNIMIITTANTTKKAIELYKEGADYVIIPHILSGEKISDMLKVFTKKRIRMLRSQHLRFLALPGIPY